MSRGLSLNKSLKHFFSRLYSSPSLGSLPYWLRTIFFKNHCFLKFLNFSALFTLND
ncbi:hypothetical protein HMPREF1451_00806 [Helicobacter pylori HP260BFii]|uniref:Uncharacterized protein n=1 Tax=Helicobacter pylori GAM260BSi TaxID=1159046 RepID=M3P8E1_HELPX|nr:hypothetical protein HMPREF1418_01572 [Helicobacter pylori GAM260BSi]EMH68337.1 hypothetical protein HMPREF1451_00806 [Helicobacter pylori HP260BFii]